MSGSETANFTFLKSLYPFYLIAEESLAEIARASERMVYGAAESIYKDGDEVDFLYFIVSGTVRIRGKRKKNTKDLAFLNRGDLFGIDGLTQDQLAHTLAYCDSRVVVIRIPRDVLLEAASHDSTLRRALRMLLKSSELSRKLDITWLTPEEPMLLVTRRHVYFLFTRLLFWGTLTLAAFAVPLYFAFTTVSSSSFFLFLSILLLCIGGVICIWAGLEWTNDYIIITSRRVSSQRQMVGFYEGRQESPMDAVLSIGVDSSAWGRIIGFGSVTVRSYTGDLRLEKLPEPDLVSALLESARRQKEIERKHDDHARIRETLTHRLEDHGKPGTKPIADSRVKIDGLIYNSGSLSDLLARFFNLRVVSQGGVTYRTHWMLLLKRTFLPALLLLLVALVTAGSAFGLITLLDETTLFILAIVGAITGWGWWVYQYIDWYNDAYIITQDQLLDISRKPLGHEERRSAPLKNIQTVEYKRNGIVGLLFNFGTVHIQIGNEELSFDNVYNPSAIQREIYATFAAFNERIKMNEQQRMADWIATYDEIQRAQGQNRPKNGVK